MMHDAILKYTQAFQGTAACMAAFLPLAHAYTVRTGVVAQRFCAHLSIKTRRECRRDHACVSIACRCCSAYAMCIRMRTLGHVIFAHVNIYMSANVLTLILRLYAFEAPNWQSLSQYSGHV